MLKKIAETIIGGAIGLAALYVVGKVAYNAGKKVGYDECHIEEQKHRVIEVIPESIATPQPTNEPVVSPTAESTPIKKKKKSALSMIFGAGRLLGNKKSVIGNLVRRPEDHKFEAFVEGDELQIHVKRKEANSRGLQAPLWRNKTEEEYG